MPRRAPSAGALGYPPAVRHLLTILALAVAACEAPLPVPEGLPARPVLGFDPDQIALLATLTGAERVPADPTNRVADDPAAAALGQALFYADEIGPTFVGCPVCHDPRRAFSGLVTYDGQGGLRLRNPPSLMGSAHQRWFFWDGRADSAWAQARTPLEDPQEVAGDRLYLAHAIRDTPRLRARYEAVFGPLPDLDDLPPRGRPGEDPALAAAWDGLPLETQQAIDRILADAGKALAAYQRRLISTDAPFDRFVTALRAGDAAAAEATLSPSARRGVALFIGPAGCVSCHNGPILSDGGFHHIGLTPDPADGHPEGRAGAVAAVLGDRFNAAGPFSDDAQGPRAARLARLAPHPDDRFAFRTPTLREVARTAPYGHDGRFETLEAIVRYKLDPDDPPDGRRSPLLVPRALDDGQIADLLAFLDALNGAPLDPALLGPPQEDAP